MKMWIRFIAEHTKKGVGNEKDHTFKVDDIVELDEKAANALIELGLAEKTSEPKVDGLDEIIGKFQTSIEETVGKALTSAIENLTKKVDTKGFLPATPRDHEKEAWRGFKDTEHFYGTVFKQAGRTNAFTGQIPDEHVSYLTKAPTGQNISTDSEGNFLVPDPISSSIWSNVQDEPTSLAARTDKWTTGGNSLRIPRIFEASRKQGTAQRNAGIQAYWLDEAAELTSSKMTTAQMEMRLHKLGALVYLTEEIMDDSGVNLEDKLSSLVANSLSFAINQALFRGTGVGKPKGILTGDSLLTIPLEAGQNSSSRNITHHNVSNMYWRNTHRNTAVWMVHPDMAQKLEFMTFNDDTSTNPIPVYLPANQVVNSPFGIMYGRPVIPYEFSSDLGQKGDILFAEWSQYATLTKAGSAGVKTASSIHVRFLFEELAMRFTTRIDGREHWTAPVEDLNGTTTRSPFVTLAPRVGGGTSSGL